MEVDWNYDFCVNGLSCCFLFAVSRNRGSVGKITIFLGISKSGKNRDGIWNFSWPIFQTTPRLAEICSKYLSDKQRVCPSEMSSQLNMSHSESMLLGVGKQ